ncbi:MAG: GNAT family N-acetyltransferase [Bacteroidota bacterium]
MKNGIRLRKIVPDDNPKVARLIKYILEDMKVPKIGTAYADAALDDMYANYNTPKAVYYVIEMEGHITACAGIAPLVGGSDTICELQKMYVAQGYRGRGLASELIQACFQKAREFGFKQCYLETLPYMEAAQILYQKNGFEYIEWPLGHTGHDQCSIYMLKVL